MVWWITIINFAAWYIFIFISVVWILVMFQNRTSFSAEDPYKPPQKLPSVSVIIPAYNEESTIEKTIKSILNLDYPKKLLEVIVVNDSSTDRTPSIIEKFRGRIRIIHNKRNRGKAHSLNKAIKVSKGELVACMDADSIVEPAILKKMVGYFSDKSIGAVTPALLAWQSKNLLQKIQQAEYILNMFLRKILSFMDSVHITPGVFSLYRKSVILEAGGFDENNLTEDMDIALKIHNLGYKIENHMGAYSYTLCPSGWKDLFRQRIRWYRGALQNSFKHKYMFFNTKYGNLGFFFLPMNIIAVFSIIIIFSLMVWNYFQTISDYVWKLGLVNWDFATLFKSFNMQTFVSGMISAPLFLSLIGLGVGIYLLYISFRASNVNISSNKSGYVIYLLVFPIILMAFWLLAMISELIKIERKW